MKKTIVFVLLLCLCFVCVSCAGKDNQDAAKEETPTRQTSTESKQTSTESQQTASGSIQSIVNEWEYDSSTESDSGIPGSWAYYGKRRRRQ